MSIINGETYIDRVDQLRAAIWMNGKMISIPLSKHPAFKGVIASQAALYDLQCTPEFEDTMTYVTENGVRAGTSFLQPRTKKELIKRRKMMQIWAEATHGMVGRSPDYMNTVLMALASSASLLEGKENCFPAHLMDYYHYVREKDLTLTHTFVDPQVNRASFYYEQQEEPIAAKVIDQNKEGLIIKGAKLLATQGGIADEILVMSSADFEEERGYGFAIPSNTKGLTFLCRPSFAADSAADFPLSARYEEIDAVVLFDRVLVPWERVFYYNNIEVANTFKNKSSFTAFTLHQVLIRRIAKLEFALGTVQRMIEMINIGEHQHVKEKAVEIIVGLETMKALLHTSETKAKRDEWGFMRPDQRSLQLSVNLFPKVYPRLTDIIQLLGSSGLMALATEADMQSSVRNELNHYLRGATVSGEEKVRLFRLAWDLTMSPFGTRETLYERFFFGDPVRLSSQLYETYDKLPYTAKVQSFLDEKG